MSRPPIKAAERIRAKLPPYRAEDEAAVLAWCRVNGIRIKGKVITCAVIAAAKILQPTERSEG